MVRILTGLVQVGTGYMVSYVYVYSVYAHTLHTKHMAIYVSIYAELLLVIVNVSNKHSLLKMITTG